MDHFAARPTSKTVKITALTAAEYRRWKKKQRKAASRWLDTHAFQAKDGQVATLPAADGSLARVVLGLGDGGDLWSFAALPGKLPNGRYAIDGQLDADLADAAAIGWGLARYRYRRYKTGDSKPQPVLVYPTGCDRGAVERTVRGIELGRDLVNTPAEDLGPAELAAVAAELAERHDAKCKVVSGARLAREYPAIHAVGRAATAARQPRLIDLRWGRPQAPKLTLVGKGVVFDSGGLDLKSAEHMRLMKKDMGGSATVLAIASMVMDAGLDVRLRVLVPAVENAVSADSYRPGDVLQTRKGTTVEVGNTDAEGRLVLCDALADAAAEEPDLLIDFATLTGAARVALGAELPALFCNDDAVADALLSAGLAAHDPDPLWRMPLHQPYRHLLDSKVADINNIAAGLGGAITAALFLGEFVGETRSWMHVDTMAWNVRAKPGRPIGGDVFGARAMMRMLADRYGTA